MTVWYIDPQNGSDLADGLTENTPRKDWHGTFLAPGDTVLFRRGTVYRGSIQSPSGEPGNPIVWGAYGEGNTPVICASVNCSDPSFWREVSENIWEAAGLPHDEVCNLVFDDGASFGTLRWTVEELCEPGDWWFSHYGCHGKYPNEPMTLRVFSNGCPADVWKDIEVVLYADRQLATASHDVVFQDLTFKNSGVHGIACIESARISVLRCRFENIGGCVWNRELRIRFGNGVEFWRAAQDNRVEDCTFRQIYDSGVTHQGAGDYPVPAGLTYRNNTFACFGMAAYEIRDVIPYDTVFSGCRCTEGGLGFSAQGETRPRRSEIWPQPMGHHLFIWRIDRPTPGGGILIEDNFFGTVPFGSAEYSIIAPEAEAQITFRNNIFAVDDPSTAIFRCGEYHFAEGKI
ncbi:MAG: right-handed parallel beta-helix repeat-containing protein [Oscillospiraceae bacterium]|nr:right-handed parallel beta-helix repeat-containing protein [Oscillospiraceae bacterium]